MHSAIVLMAALSGTALGLALEAKDAGNPYESEYEWLVVGRTSTSPTLRISGGVVARDSNGREVEEESFRAGAEEGLPITILYDPVAAVNYVVDRHSDTILSATHAEHCPVRTIDIGSTAIALPVGTYAEGAPCIGQQMIEGLLCTGYSRRLESGVLEYWVSDELEAVLLARVIHGDTERVFRMYNIRRGEPGAELFRIPQVRVDS